MTWSEQIGMQSWRVRYRTGDGHTASISGFTIQRAADNYAADIECDQRSNTWLDPHPRPHHRRRMGHHLVLRTRPRATHDRQLPQRPALLHPAPMGSHPLNAITALGVNKWISDLRQLGYANTTVATIIKVLSMILTDAIDERLIPTNPIRRY
jgi:hypothetical protein